MSYDKQLVFRVRACHDVKLLLTNPEEESVNFEVILGSNHNTESSLRLVVVCTSNHYILTLY